MESRFVQAGPVKAAILRGGRRPETIVLVHGYASSAALWRYTIEHLSRERQDGTPRFRIIAFNNRGPATLAVPIRKTVTRCSLSAEDLYNAVSELGLSDFILMGHSMGGATVTQFSMAHQDMLRARAAELCAVETGECWPTTGKSNCGCPSRKAA